jgi:hypothetical protein
VGSESQIFFFWKYKQPPTSILLQTLLQKCMLLSKIMKCTLNCCLRVMVPFLYIAFKKEILHKMGVYLFIFISWFAFVSICLFRSIFFMVIGFSDFFFKGLMFFYYAYILTSIISFSLHFLRIMLMIFGCFLYVMDI